MNIENAIKYMENNGTIVEKLSESRYKLTNPQGVSIELNEQKFIEFVEEYKEAQKRADDEDYCVYNNKPKHWCYYLNHPIEE